MKPLWDKGKKLDATVLDFTAGQDAILDTQLAYYDAIASCAHVKALAKAGLLSKPEAKTLVTKLAAIADKAADGKFAIDAEDCHSAIEQALGDMGKKVHLGRSRNDQAATAMRLYLKDMLLDAGSKQALLADMLQSMALKHKDTPMPGYSHTRKAMVSSVGHWLGSYAELLSLTVPRLGVIDLSPLGSASGFGTSATVDRTFEAKLLGFAGVQQNALGCQAGRVMAEAHACQQMLSIMTVLSQLAADIIFFSAEGIGYVKISPDIATGSSLMPNKQNPDVFELVRAKASSVLGHCTAVQSLGIGMLSGYNRDYQQAKAHVMQAAAETLASLEILSHAMRHISIDDDACLKACTSDMAATDVAIQLAIKGVPFRDAYRKAVPKEVKPLTKTDALRLVDARKSIGATGNPTTMAKNIKTAQDALLTFSKQLEGCSSWDAEQSKA